MARVPVGPPMRLLVECLADNASVNIADRLRELVDWKEMGLFDGRRVLAHDDLRLITIDEMHITHENLHEQLPPSLVEPEVVVFLSRHKAASGTPSLSVHPIGNWNQAPYGGREGTVVPTRPRLMGGMLRTIADQDPEGYEVTLEATHHGPYLDAPTLFLELGSSQDQWDDEDAGRILARTVLEAEPLDADPVLWVGGGHYCPQLNDLVLSGELAPGHVIPNWATKDPITDQTLQMAIDGMPGCQGFVVQRNPTTDEQKIAERLEAMGVDRIEV